MKRQSEPFKRLAAGVSRANKRTDPPFPSFAHIGSNAPPFLSNDLIYMITRYKTNVECFDAPSRKYEHGGSCSPLLLRNEIDREHRVICMVYCLDLSAIFRK